MAKRRQKKDTSPARTEIAPVSLFANGRSWLPQALVLIAVALWIYWPALHGDWLWDDDHYITDNDLLRSTAGLWKIWFQPGISFDYYPLEATVSWVQWHLWQLDTPGYHVTNVLLHIVSSLLVWRLLSKFHLKLAWLGGLLFAIHPVQVESVAWIAELKNTLSLPLVVGAMCLYLDYDAEKRPRDYLLALVLFLAALLCKLSVVFLPVVILLHVWWKRGRITAQDWKASAPFFAASLAVGLITMLSGIWASQFNHHQADNLPGGGILGRIDLAGLAFSFYFSKVFLPVGLLPVYPKWPVVFTEPTQYLPWLVWAGFFFWCWTKRQAWGRHVLLGLGFFLINLAPCPGFVPAPNMGFAWVMDHFLYLPIIGLIGLFIAALGQLGERLSTIPRRATMAALAVVMACLAWESHAYASLYIDSQTLWSYTLARNPAARPALLNLAGVFVDQHNYAEALPFLQEAVQLQPDDSDARYDLAYALANSGQGAEAQEQYREIIRQAPDYPKAYVSLGGMMLKAGDNAGAEALYQQGLQYAPDDATLCVNLGGLLMKQGRTAEVVDLYERALKDNPDLAQIQYNLGLALLGLGKLQDAADHLETAVNLDPTLTAAHENLGVAFAQSGRLPEAIEQFQAVIQLNPQSITARENLALALVQTGHIPEAIDQFQQVLRIDPNNAKARDSLGKLRQFQLQQAAPGGH